jgi:alkanesulfonate monooxygenase SsuD/methylene tetrahydromethanopterin reductase-like flavin-dependent oxidoreductase (luciferase family)
VFGDPARVAHKVEVLRAHCAAVGRDPADVEVTHLTTALAADDRKKLRATVDRLRDRNTSADAYLKRVNAGTVEDLVTLFRAYSGAGANHSIISMPDVSEEGSIERFADVIASLSSP